MHNPSSLFRVCMYAHMNKITVFLHLHCNLCSEIFLALIFFQGMPICLVSKGRSPTGRIECITASQSCYQLQLNPADFGNMPKNMFPIVITYNGRDHFVPTIPCSEKGYLAWKVHKEFGSLAAAT